MVEKIKPTVRCSGIRFIYILSLLLKNTKVGYHEQVSRNICLAADSIGPAHMQRKTLYRHET